MATSKETMDYILDCIGMLPDLSSKKMFGEYGIWVEGKIVALVCDDQLFIKPNSAAKSFLETVEESPPYPGAKNYYRISEEVWEEPGYLAHLISISAQVLPVPKKKVK